MHESQLACIVLSASCSLSFAGLQAVQSKGAGLQVDREGTNESETWVLTKGAPEVVRSFLKDPPTGYDEGYKEFAAQGGR